MAQHSITGSDANESLSDFAAHLQQRLGVSRLELGECLTEYRPARSYSIVFGPTETARGESGFGFGAE
jgi:hypothetical protein